MYHNIDSVFMCVYVYCFGSAEIFEYDTIVPHCTLYSVQYLVSDAHFVQCVFVYTILAVYLFRLYLFETRSLR